MSFIIPIHFKASLNSPTTDEMSGVLNPEAISKIKEVSQSCSKARGVADKWKEDSEIKEREATENVKKASRMFLDDIYIDMNKWGEQDKLKRGM